MQTRHGRLSWCSRRSAAGARDRGEGPGGIGRSGPALRWQQEAAPAPLPQPPPHPLLLHVVAVGSTLLPARQTPGGPCTAAALPQDNRQYFFF